MKSKLELPLRDLVDRVASIKSRMAVLEQRLEVVEMETGMGLASEAEGMDEEDLAQFRAHLVVGMTGHLEGLQSRQCLNGKVGLLEKWHKETGRWAMRIGREVVLVRPENVVP